MITYKLEMWKVYVNILISVEVTYSEYRHIDKINICNYSVHEGANTKSVLVIHVQLECFKTTSL